MPFDSPTPPTRFEVVDRWDGGLGWLAYPEETMARASHALTVEREDDPTAPPDVWVIDPLRAPGIEDRLRNLGNVVGVVVLLGRHSRDSVTFARRFDVPLYLPTGIDIDVPADVNVVRVEEGLPGTAYDFVETVSRPGWHEAALTDGETLVVADALGTASYFTTGDERIGVHPFLRLVPPRALRNETPIRILTGHGAGIMEDGGPALDDALSGSRRRLPRLYLQILRNAIPDPRRIFSRSGSVGPGDADTEKTGDGIGSYAGPDAETLSSQSDERDAA